MTAAETKGLPMTGSNTASSLIFQTVEIRHRNPFLDLGLKVDEVSPIRLGGLGGPPIARIVGICNDLKALLWALIACVQRHLAPRGRGPLYAAH